MPRPLGSLVLVGLAVVVVVLTGCGPDTEGRGATVGADGLWLLRSLEVDGQDIALAPDRPIFLEIDGDEVGGDTVCNAFGGTFGGDFSQETMGCEPDDDPTVDLHQVEGAMIEAVLAGPELVDERLTFASGSARLVYEAIDDPTPAELFSVLDDDSRTASTDEIYLDPEAGRHPDYQRLVRLDHPGTGASFHLGVDGELVCFAVSTADAASTRCVRPRLAARLTWAEELRNRDGPVGVHAALIPDAFVSAVAARPDLGEVSGNVLLIADGVPTGVHEFEEPDGDRFVLSILGAS